MRTYLPTGQKLDEEFSEIFKTNYKTGITCLDCGTSFAKVKKGNLFYFICRDCEQNISEFNTYGIYIKSDSEAPDYEDKVYAKNKKDASKMFVKKINVRGGDWAAGDLIKYIKKLN